MPVGGGAGFAATARAPERGGPSTLVHPTASIARGLRRTHLLIATLASGLGLFLALLPRERPAPANAFHPRPAAVQDVRVEHGPFETLVVGLVRAD